MVHTRDSGISGVKHATRSAALGKKISRISRLIDLK
jgi:hypothetical protein